jgi:hypothetical protein
MQTTSFALAPATRRHDWDKALAFAIAPAAPTFAAIYFFAGGFPLAAIVTGACFIGTFLCAFTLASTQVGRLELTEDALLLKSGFLQNRIPLCDLDLSATRLGDHDSASPRLVTIAHHAVTIPRRSGPPLVVSPLHPDSFVITIQNLST